MEWVILGGTMFLVSGLYWFADGIFGDRLGKAQKELEEMADDQN